MTRFLQGNTFWGVVDNAAHSGVQIPKSPIFADVNMHFQAKQSTHTQPFYGPFPGPPG